MMLLCLRKEGTAINGETENVGPSLSDCTTLERGMERCERRPVINYFTVLRWSARSRLGTRRTVCWTWSVWSIGSWHRDETSVVKEKGKEKEMSLVVSERV